MLFLAHSLLVLLEDGTLCKVWCIVTYEAYFCGAAEWTEEDPFDEAEVEALNKKKRYGYIMKYYLGKEERYILMGKKCLKDLNKIMTGSPSPEVTLYSF